MGRSGQLARLIALGDTVSAEGGAHERDEPFLRTIGCCRLVYNLCLDQKKLERERSGRGRCPSWTRSRN
jgi:hypothetical protein